MAAGIHVDLKGAGAGGTGSCDYEVAWDCFESG
jgi:hypothetical protein